MPNDHQNTETAETALEHLMHLGFDSGWSNSEEFDKASSELADLRRKAVLVDTAEARIAEQMAAAALDDSVPLKTVQALMLDFAIAWQGEVERLAQADLEKEITRRTAEADKRHEEGLRELANAKEDRERFRGISEALATELRECQNERDAYHSNLEMVAAGAAGVWLWQGDDEDDPPSLSCPVVMSADTLRAFVADRERADALQARLDGLTDGDCAMSPEQATSVVNAAFRGAKVDGSETQRASDLALAAVAREQLARCRGAIAGVSDEDIARRIVGSASAIGYERALLSAPGIRELMLTTLSPQETANADQS